MRIRKRGFSLNFLMLIIVVSGFLSSCKDDKYDKIEKYQRPDWLEGKVFTQMSNKEDGTLSMFVECVEAAGLDSLIDKSGTYAIFAPNNGAFQAYLTENGYADVAAIPDPEKVRIVKYHILQMPWSSEQLQSLSSKGWIDMNDVSNNKPRAFKRETLLKDENKTYYIDLQPSGLFFTEEIVPKEQSNAERVVFANSRKFAPIFFDGFMNASELTSEDYSFYFGRPFEFGSMYYAGGKVIDEVIYAENGYVYTIDKVIAPLKNAEELLSDTTNQSYTSYRDLLYETANFRFNEDETQSQEGALEGKEVDQLYDLTYYYAAFDIHQELTFESRDEKESRKKTLEEHHGMIAPTNEAFKKLVETVLTGDNKWNNLAEVPDYVKQIVINSYMSVNPIYKQDIDNGFFNKTGDFIQIKDEDIVQKTYGSNCTFIGIKEPIVPKSFSSVVGALFLSPKFNTTLYAMNRVNYLGALSDATTQFTIFNVYDSDLLASRTLTRVVDQLNTSRVSYQAWDMGEEKDVVLEISEIKKWIGGHIGVQPLIGQAHLEFIETIDRRHLIVNNDLKIVTGGSKSKNGYNGGDEIDIVFDKFETQEPFTNGSVYGVNGWIEFGTSEARTIINETMFLDLLVKAGYADSYNVGVPDDDQRYTLFMPTDEAITAAQADTLTGENLKKFVLSHFVENDLIFTDGRLPSKKYNTKYSVLTNSGRVYIQLNIQTGIDQIVINDNNGDEIIKIEERVLEEGEVKTTNFIGVKKGNDGISNETNAVIHKINAVLFTPATPVATTPIGE